MAFRISISLKEKKAINYRWRNIALYCLPDKCERPTYFGKRLFTDEDGLRLFYQWSYVSHCASVVMDMHLFCQHKAKWMTLPNLSKEMSMFRIGRAVLCQKPLWHNGFWLSHYRGPYVTKQIQTGQNQDTKRVSGRIWTPTVSLGGVFITHECVFNLVWYQTFQGIMWALCIVKLDVGGKPTLGSRLWGVNFSFQAALIFENNVLAHFHCKNRNWTNLVRICP